MNKTVFTLLLVATICFASLTMISCGSDSGTLENMYMLSVPTKIEEIDWYTLDNYSLELLSGDKYRLVYKTDIFGGSDLVMKGNRTLIFWGDCASAPSADGEPSHLDIALQAPTRIFYEQHGKRWGRHVDFLSGDLLIDTAAWTDLMTQIYDPEATAKGAEEFLAENAHPMTVTVENPSLVPEDSSLVYRITEAPVFQFKE